MKTIYEKMDILAEYAKKIFGEIGYKDSNLVGKCPVTAGTSALRIYGNSQSKYLYIDKNYREPDKGLIDVFFNEENKIGAIDMSVKITMVKFADINTVKLIIKTFIESI